MRAIARVEFSLFIVLNLAIRRLNYQSNVGIQQTCSKLKLPEDRFPHENSPFNLHQALIITSETTRTRVWILCSDFLAFASDTVRESYRLFV